MNLAMIRSLFALFSGEQDPEPYLPLLMTAIREVTGKLTDDSRASEVRLCYLAAAIANLRFTEMYGAREKSLATYAGTVSRKSDWEQQLRFAKHLVSSYEALCRDLLRDDKFLFFSVGGGCYA